MRQCGPSRNRDGASQDLLVKGARGREGVLFCRVSAKPAKSLGEGGGSGERVEGAGWRARSGRVAVGGPAA